MKLDAHLSKYKQANTKLEAFLKEIEERGLVEITNLLFKEEKTKAMTIEWVKKLKECDAKL